MKLETGGEGSRKQARIEERLVSFLPGLPGIQSRYGRDQKRIPRSNFEECESQPAGGITHVLTS